MVEIKGQVWWFLGLATSAACNTQKKYYSALSSRPLSVNGSSVALISLGRRENLVGETDIPQETVLGFQAADISCKQGLSSQAPSLRINCYHPAPVLGVLIVTLFTGLSIFFFFF